ncbi:transcription factor ABORTED MICROSPORES isoform X2 [Benincasa hispida]|uniref:transcription factor ABORTED MICROSPORES isoform X2 n=1 Tax=Benincasa hispida TaxID=102211 RepID=UPI0019021AF0|nr:transcription factor ABORTED MICROSPORES isoform X2 [Benincasa hispida]
MRSFQGALECLRALVETKLWDYCIVWKSRDDSSSSGGVSDASGKKEAGETIPAMFCKDTRFRHFRRTNACQALAQFPSSIALNSGVHGDVLISNQPMWLTSGEVSSISSFSHELTGTRVLIPVSGGIVELFATKHMAREGEVIDFVMAHCNVSVEQEFDKESEPNAGLNEKRLHSSTKFYPVDWPDPQPLLGFKSKLEILPSISQSSCFPSCGEGSSSGSKPSNEHQNFDSYSSFISRGLFNQPIQRSFESKSQMHQEDLLEQQRDVASKYSKSLEKDEAKTGGKQGKEVFKSKNLMTERRRRNKIRDRLYALRALVPNISKMDRASIIVDAINYIRELEENVKSLQNELIQLEHKDQKNIHLKISPLENKNDDTNCWPLVQDDQPMFIFGEEKPMEVEVEVMQINERDFLIKLFCKRKQGGVVSSIEAMDSLGLQVVDVNITTFGGMVLNIFHVEANENDIQPKRLRDSLIKLTSREIRQLK